jgi:hypothetical protein
MSSVINPDIVFDTYNGYISMEESLMTTQADPWDTHDPRNTDSDRDDWDGEYGSIDECEYVDMDYEEWSTIDDSDLFDNDLITGEAPDA